MEMTFDTDVVVVGAGVIGLACARVLARSGHEVLILEQHSAFGTETSSRNSEVIHAGIYYPAGSLKARLCVTGRDLLYEFCNEYGVNHYQCGKLIVSTASEQEDRLYTLREQAMDNGVTNLKFLSRSEVSSLEPELRCTSALVSPSTGIIDSHGFMFALLGDAERHGAQLVLQTPVERVIAHGTGFDVLTGGSSPTQIKTRYLINAAGLAACKIAATIEGLDAHHIPELLLAKGNYFSLSGKAPFRRLVYPIPEPGGLGIHFTLDLGGQGRFGPDVEWIDHVQYEVDDTRVSAFYAAVRRYWPEIKDNALSPAYSGIRPKLTNSSKADADFLIQDATTHQINGLVNFFGIESPGLTAALALSTLCLEQISKN